MKHGVGEMTWTRGDVYHGDWENNKMHGHGTYTWSAGRIYEGEWVKHQRHGHGVETLPTTEVYDGDWRSNQRHGIGMLRQVSGEWRESQWRMGEFVKWTAESVGKTAPRRHRAGAGGLAGAVLAGGVVGATRPSFVP
eukprot:PLAT5367.3.p3 GENE.PLAT5367.3~~PLAT5367.3.p3  ORF type:complete len:137 (-),score=34.54 PLAT5367.3:115-525(-)